MVCHAARAQADPFRHLTSTSCVDVRVGLRLANEKVLAQSIAHEKRDNTIIRTALSALEETLPIVFRSCLSKCVRVLVSCRQQV